MSDTRRLAALFTAAMAIGALTIGFAPAGAGAAAAEEGSSAACPWVGSTAPIETRVASVLEQMTLDEKITMVHGVEGMPYTGWIPANDRLCIPKLKLQDGPLGVRGSNTTQLPAATSLASSFDRDLAYSYGSVIGTEGKALGVDVSLGPTVNIVRDPRWGRAFETYSEDPYLTAQIAVGDINGIQAQGVAAQVKHWAVYNQETNRNTLADNAVIDDRTMHEIYASAFETIIDESDPSSAMCSYSVVNGEFACENSYLNNILKNQFGFDGFITSDWSGTHSTVASANAGMDMEMPGGSYFGAPLKQAILDGKVPQSRLDDMVTRVMRVQFRFGLFDNPSADTINAVASTPENVSIARKVAEDGTVLLKNEGQLLPLGADVESIAVIGDGAGVNTMTTGGGSAALGLPGTGTVTPFEGIKARAGSGVDVRYAQGNPPDSSSLPTIESEYLAPSTGSGEGLRGDYYNGTNLAGPSIASRTDPQVAFNWPGGSPAAGVPGMNFSAKWTGTLTAPTTGTYTFGLTSDDGSRLFIDGEQVIDNWRDQAANTETARVALTAGEPVQIEVDYYQAGGDGSVNLGWTVPGQDSISDAAALAADSDVAIVYANLFESEEWDLPSIDLPDDQNELIAAVAEANPNTVVVLNTGSAVTMPWIDKVAGVFEAWYPGQESGNAIASLLFGDVNPSGKLPVTFPTSLDQVPASTPAQWPGVDGDVQYSEGLYVGYRWYDAKNLTPLFPFGYGLSYTDFEYSNLVVSDPTMDDGGTVSVSVDVTNTGSRAGADVVQLYLTNPASADEPISQLKGFEKTSLNPGETKTVTLEVTSKDASYWNTEAQQWALPLGSYTVRVGNSSRNLLLSGTFEVDKTAGPRYTTVTAPEISVGGSTLTVETTFTNASTEPVSEATTDLTVPEGWSKTASTAASFGTVPAGESVSTTWELNVPEGESGGSATLTARTAYPGSEGVPSEPTTVTIAYSNLAAAFDTVGVTDNSDISAGDLDPLGYSFSAQSLASVGVTPGVTITSESASYIWPDVPAGQPNAVTADGQIISVNGTGPTVSFLATGVVDDQTGTVTLTYSDGSTSTANLPVANWFNNEALPGSALAFTSPNWNAPPSNGLGDHAVSAYSIPAPIDAGKQLAYVTLPANRNIKVFAIVTAGPVDDGENPGGGDGENPGGGDGENPGGGDGENPGAGDGENPGAGDGENPGAGSDDTAGSDQVASGNGALAFTGTPAFTGLLAAGGLIAALLGAAIVMIRRRRRHV